MCWYFPLKQWVFLGSLHLLWTHITTWSSVTSVLCHVAPFLALGTDTETKSSVSETVAFKASAWCSCPSSSSLCVRVHSSPQGVVSNREELISTVALAPCGFGIRGVEPGRSKMRRGGWVAWRNYFGGRFAILRRGRVGRWKERRKREGNEEWGKKEDKWLTQCQRSNNGYQPRNKSKAVFYLSFSVMGGEDETKSLYSEGMRCKIELTKNNFYLNGKVASVNFIYYNVNMVICSIKHQTSSSLQF